jgi:signal transduction histidine kinase
VVAGPPERKVSDDGAVGSDGAQELVRVIAGLRADLGASLGEGDALARAAKVLVPTLGATSMSLTLADGTVLGPLPEQPDGTDPPDPDPAGAEVHTVALDAAGRHIGELAVTRAGDPWSVTELALLDATGAFVAGAIERGRLFGEVMELERLKTDFIARVSHELRTPITIITGFLDTMLAHDAHLPADQRHHMLERSRSAATRLGRLIEELLVLSRIEAGVLMPEPSDVPVRQLLAEVKAAAVEPDQVVTVDADGASLHTDRGLLARALGLVVDNAIKYGGTAEVSVERADDAWCIDVRDRGPGFADDVTHTAFEMFTRSASVTSVPGLGVGLPIARTIVEVLDGAIELLDPPDRLGATLRIRLPR